MAKQKWPRIGSICSERLSMLYTVHPLSYTFQPGGLMERKNKGWRIWSFSVFSSSTDFSFLHWVNDNNLHLFSSSSETIKIPNSLEFLLQIQKQKLFKKKQMKSETSVQTHVWFNINRWLHNKNIYKYVYKYTAVYTNIFCSVSWEKWHP